MSPAWIRPRSVKVSARNPRGKSYQVLFRRGGRDKPIEAAGSFSTEKEAKLRRDLVAGWLAAGRNPKDELALIGAAPAKVRNLNEWAVAFKATRIDVSTSSVNHDNAALTVLTEKVGHMLPERVQVADLQELVADLSERLAPSTFGTYVAKWRMLFAYTGIDPNPASSKHLRLPKDVREQIAPPNANHVLAVLRIAPARILLPLVVLEQTAMRVGEAETLTWGDVDERGNQFRLRSANTKTSKARWVQLPTWLMEIVSATCPVDDRHVDRRVFGTFTAQYAQTTLRRLCVTAGVPLFSPHDLRHRRATIWHHDQVPVRVLMERGGWSRSNIPLEVYSHLLPLEEVPVEAFRELLVVPA